LRLDQQETSIEITILPRKHVQKSNKPQNLQFSHPHQHLPRNRQKQTDFSFQQSQIVKFKSLQTMQPYWTIYLGIYIETLAENLISTKIKPKPGNNRPKFNSSGFQKPRTIKASVPASKPVPDINKNTNSVTSSSNHSQHEENDFSDEFDDDLVLLLSKNSSKREDLPEKNELNDSNDSNDSDPPSPIIRTKHRFSFSSESENDELKENFNPSSDFFLTARGGQVGIDVNGLAAYGKHVEVVEKQEKKLRERNKKRKAEESC